MPLAQQYRKLIKMGAQPKSPADRIIGFLIIGVVVAFGLIFGSVFLYMDSSSKAKKGELLLHDYDILIERLRAESSSEDGRKWRELEMESQKFELEARKINIEEAAIQERVRAVNSAINLRRKNSGNQPQ